MTGAYLGTKDDTPEGVLPFFRTVRESMCHRGTSFARDRGLVFGASTGLEFGNIFSGSENRSRLRVGQGSSFLIDFFDFLPHPADAGDFDLAIRLNPEDAGHVGQTIGARDRVRIGVVEQDRKGDTVFLVERACVFLLILRDPNDG